MDLRSLSSPMSRGAHVHQRSLLVRVVRGVALAANVVGFLAVGSGCDDAVTLESSHAGEVRDEGRTCQAPYACTLAANYPGLALVPGAGEECPTDFSLIQRAVAELPIAAADAQCSCDCGASQGRGRCTEPPSSYSVLVGTDLTCSRGRVPSGQCGDPKVPTVSIEAPPIPIRQATWAGRVAKIVPPVSASYFHVCQAHAAPREMGAANCPSSHVCLRAVPPGTRACMQLTREGPCPPELPIAIRLAEVFDRRDCSGCSCETTDVCENARIEIYDATDVACTTPRATVPADGTCHATGITDGVPLYRADVVPSTGVRVAYPSVPTGAALAPRAELYCCNQAD
jgi:hypothetical protein